MATSTKERVLVTELSTQMSGENPVYWLDQVGAKTEPDWAGRPTVSVRDAKAAFDAYQTAMAEHAEKEALYRQYLEDRARERLAVGQKAYEEAIERGRERQAREMAADADGYAFYGIGSRFPLSPVYQQQAWQARYEAEQKFDRKRPAKTFIEFKPPR